MEGAGWSDGALGNAGTATENEVDRFDAEMIHQPRHDGKKVAVASDGAGYLL
jgi:hypothetical protein